MPEILTASLRTRPVRTAPDVPAHLRDDLPPGEPVVAFAWARLPRPRMVGVTLAPIGTILYAVDVVRGRLAIGEIRERSAAFGFPLDRHMAMAATAHRLVIWRATRSWWRAPRLLGDVARDRIVGARLPYVGGVWRVVEVDLAGAGRCRFLVDRRHAEAFVRALG